MTEARHLAQMPLKIGGSDAPRDMMHAIKEIVVDTSLHLPDMFTIHLDDNTLHWIDSPLLEIGTEIEISGTPGGSEEENGSATQLITQGEITAIEPELMAEAGSSVIIRGYDKSHRLYRGKKSRVFTQVSDGDIVQRIARDCGLRADVETTNQVYDHVFQDYQTDMEFIQGRAERVGYLAYVKDGTLHFGRETANGGQRPTLELGDNLRDFQARFTTAEQVGEVEVHGWDPKAKQAIIGKATSPRGTPTVNSQSHGGTAAQEAFNLTAQEVVNKHPLWTQAEAETLAQSVLDDRCHAFFHGEGTCFGNPAVRAGADIELKGIGQRFSGIYRVTRAIHRYDLAGYVTHFEISGHRANTLGQLLSGNDNRGYGVVIGIVTNAQDPDGLARVKVKYPTISDQLESHWARLVTPMAGAGRGFEFIPEVNDEVLVAFEYDDINKPYILGALWNGKDKPPQASDAIVSGDGKVQKRIIHSRSGHTITLDDTAGGEKISIVDKTGTNLLEIDSKQNTMSMKTSDGHKIVMEPKGIILESAGTLTLKSTGNMEIQTQANMTTKSTGNTDIQATASMNVKSTGMMKVQGTSASIDGGPMTEIKGGVVKIN
ncbi:MAG: VgrG-related protein [Dehalococcoidia bacterium]|nr:VgrG-related protein [Dehalococcoidia bacterium]